LGKGFHTITSFHKTQLYVHQFEDRKRSRSSTTSTSIPRYVVPLLSRIPRCFPSSEEQQKQRTATAAAGSILIRRIVPRGGYISQRIVRRLRNTTGSASYDDPGSPSLSAISCSGRTKVGRCDKRSENTPTAPNIYTSICLLGTGNSTVSSSSFKSPSSQVHSLIKQPSFSLHSLELSATTRTRHSMTPT